MNSHNTLAPIQSSRNFVPCVLWVANFSSNQAARKKQEKNILKQFDVSLWRQNSRDQYWFPPSQCRKPCPNLYWPKYSEFLFLTLEAKRRRKQNKRNPTKASVLSTWVLFRSTQPSASSVFEYDLGWCLCWL